MPFPKFEDGDTLLVVSPAHTYLLHAHVLRRCSGFFSSRLIEETSIPPDSNVDTMGLTARWRFNLRGRGTSRPTFVPVTRRRDPDDSIAGAADVEKAAANDAVCRHYDNVFRLFYDQPVAMDNTRSATVVSGCLDMVRLAIWLQALEQIAQFIHITLQDHIQVVHHILPSDPLSWACLTYRIKTPVLFHDAVVHLVGRWKTFSPGQQCRLPLAVYALCERKCNEFYEFKRGVEMDIMAYYPSALRTKSPDNIYAWMALSLFRQWFLECLIKGKVKDAPDGGCLFYTLLSRGGSSYLPPGSAKAMAAFLPMTTETESAIERHLDTYKHEIKQFVEPLIQNRTNYTPPASHSFKYLVSAKVSPEDYPWAGGKTSQ